MPRYQRDFQPRPSRLRSQVRSQIAQILLALLERIIGKSDLIGVHYLDLGMIVSRSVGRIQVRTSTGQLQVTNRLHGLPTAVAHEQPRPGSAGEASTSWVEFNYQDDTEGRLLTPVIFDSNPKPSFSPTDTSTTVL